MPLRKDANIDLKFVLENKNSKKLRKFLRDRQPTIGISLAEVTTLCTGSQRVRAWLAFARLIVSLRLLN